MTYKKDFKSIWSQLNDILKEETFILDVDLMIKLRFSPPSWKVWKSKFLEYARTRTTYHHNFKTDKRKYYQILYNKKDKEWSCKYLGEFDPPYDISKIS